MWGEAGEGRFASFFQMWSVRRSISGSSDVDGFLVFLSRCKEESWLTCAQTRCERGAAGLENTSHALKRAAKRHLSAGASVTFTRSRSVSINWSCQRTQGKRSITQLSCSTSLIKAFG